MSDCLSLLMLAAVDQYLPPFVHWGLENRDILILSLFLGGKKRENFIDRNTSLLQFGFPLLQFV